MKWFMLSVLAVSCLAVSLGCGNRAEQPGAGEQVRMMSTTRDGDGQVIETQDFRVFGEPKNTRDEIKIQLSPGTGNREVTTTTEKASSGGSWWGWGGNDGDETKVTVRDK
jgi:hypothetical protein